jgi:hypothetical protein
MMNIGMLKSISDGGFMFKGEDHEQKPIQSPTQERNINSRARRDEPIQSKHHSSTSVASTPFSLYNTTISTHETRLLAFESGLMVGSKNKLAINTS